MKLLFAVSTYEDISTSVMGSERAMIEVARALVDRGHEVTITNLLHTAPDWDRGFDVIHLFNGSGQKGSYLNAIQTAKLLYKPIFFTPVFWPMDEMRAELIMMLEMGQKRHEQMSKGIDAYLAGVKLICMSVDWLLPNAEIEMEEVIEHVKEDEPEMARSLADRYTVIPNGVNVREGITKTLEDDEPFAEHFEKKLAERFVLCVGRVEVRKNQYRLFRAMEKIWEDDPDLQLVLMGEMSTQYIATWSKETHGKNVLFCPEGPPMAVLKLMKRCQAHILPSFIETPGLVNLEAAALGKNIVVADRGSVREYFGDEAYYCDPTDPESIAEAILAALGSSESPELAERIRRDYSYEKVAEATEAAYEKALAY